MSSWKRGFLEIIGEILDNLAGNQLRKTHITYKCNLDSRAVTKYLSIMLHAGLIEISKMDSNFYTITEKGIKYRNQFNSFASLMEKDLEKIPIKHLNSQELLTNLKMQRA